MNNKIKEISKSNHNYFLSRKPDGPIKKSFVLSFSFKSMRINSNRLTKIIFAIGFMERFHVSFRQKMLIAAGNFIKIGFKRSQICKK